MALPGHSPPPFLGPGSPPRNLNGHPDHSLPPPPPMSAPSRPMLPPSPQHYQQRYPGHIGPSPSPSSYHDSRGPPPPLPPPQKRPGSSMSISSMLGGEPERPPQEQYQNHAPHSRHGSVSAPSMSLGAVMSPPQQLSRPGIGEYSYHPRSQTPDRLPTTFTGSRQRSASSGSAMAPNSRFYEQADHLNQNPLPPFGPSPQSAPFATTQTQREEHSDRIRRTSLSGILQRPNSQPQASVTIPPPVQQYTVPPPAPVEQYLPTSMQGVDLARQNGLSGGYDTRPPGMGDASRPGVTTHASPSQMNSISPEIRRPTMNGTHNRGLASLLNGPTSQPLEGPNGGSQNMARQDSAQSQSDRSTFGDRGRFRHYSPFAGSVASQQGSSGTFDDQSRKGSDEIAHKAIVGLGLDNRRGRYSPVPQAVQGAQAQTPVPDGGVKSEHGRVFSGLGGGMVPTPAVPTSIPGPLPASPFKRDAVMASQSEEYPNKMARTASGMGKRVRKLQDDDGEVFENKKSTSNKGNKRAKHQNSYKADLEEMAASGMPRRTTPFSLTNSLRNTITPVNGVPVSNPTQKFDTTPIFKPKKTVKVASVMAAVLKKPRRHLGNFEYDPQILVPDTAAIGDPDFDVCIRPKLLPAFTENEYLNCTYTVRISKTWVQDVERRIVCTTRNLWGTGIYSDDSDPLAAAMHMGWLKASYNAGVDESLMAKVVDEQNPKVDVSKDFQPPSQPLDVTHGKDLKITLVVMPQLERYDESARYGVKSRSWPEGFEKTPHDGVSFAILKVEFIDIGPEERRSGRTGETKRKRLRAQIEARAKAAQVEKERLANIKKKQADRHKQQILGAKDKGTPKVDEKENSVVHTTISKADTPNAAEALTNADGKESKQQIATAAA